MDAAITLKGYCEERIQSIGAVLQKPKKDISGEDIHKLRVEIKKLRAAAQLVLCCAPGFNKKTFLKPYNNVFKEAGHVRELQIEVSMLKKLSKADNLKKYTKQLNKQVKKAKHHFVSLLDANLPGKVAASSKDILPYVVAVQENDVRQFLQAQSCEMDGLTHHGLLKKKEAHELRRLLKVFYYVLLMFETNDDKVKDIDAFQELLGQWHDDVVTKTYLQKAVHSGSLHGAQKKHVRAAKDNVADEGKTLFKTLNSKFSEFQEAKQQALQRLSQGV